MPSFNEMVVEVLGHLRAHTRNQELSTHLTSAITSSTTVIPVADATVISRGRIQIGDELIWVDSTDRQASEMTIPPYGRGMDGTTAASHSTGDRIVVQPMYPNKAVKDQINQVITSLGGQLYALATTQLTVDPNVAGYELPATCEKVVSVVQEWTHGTATFSEHVRHWKFEPNAQASLSATGKALMVYEPFPFNCKLNVTYLKNPSTLSGAQVFTDTGLAASAEDLVVIGTAARLLAGTAAGMTNNRTVEANTLDSKIQPNYALQQARYLQTLFQQRLQEEQLKLTNSYSIRAHYTG